MRHFAIAIVLCIAGACGKDSTSTTASPGSSAGSAAQTAGSAASGSAVATGSGASDSFDQAIVELAGYKARMCACADRICADAVQAEFKSWRLGMKAKIRNQKPNPEQDAKGNALDHEMKACRKKLEFGAGSASGSDSGDKIETALVELEKFKARMCACTDKACTDQTHDDFKVWKRDLKASVAERPSKSQDERGNALDKDMKDCRKRIEAGTGLGPSSTTQKLEAALVAMSEFRTRMCTCKDKACGDQVDKDVSAWALRESKDLADAKPTKEQEARAKTIQAELKTCKSALK